MSIKEILEELPKLTPEEKRQLWNVLNHEVAHDVEEETPEVLAAIDEGIRSLESGKEPTPLKRRAKWSPRLSRKLAGSSTSDVFGNPFQSGD